MVFVHVCLREGGGGGGGDSCPELPKPVSSVRGTATPILVQVDSLFKLYDGPSFLVYVARLFISEQNGLDHCQDS